MELRASDTGLIIAATVDRWQGSAGDRRPYADQHGLSPADPIMMMPSPRSIARQNDTPGAHAAGYSRPAYIIGSSGSLLNGIGDVPKARDGRRRRSDNQLTKKTAGHNGLCPAAECWLTLDSYLNIGSGLTVSRLVATSLPSTVNVTL